MVQKLKSVCKQQIDLDGGVLELRLLLLLLRAFLLRSQTQRMLPRHGILCLQSPQGKAGRLNPTVLNEDAVQT